MQVALAAQPVGTSGEGGNSVGTEKAWQPFSQVSVWFAVIVISGVICMTCCGLAGVVLYIVNRVFVGMKENRAWLKREKVVDEEKNERK